MRQESVEIQNINPAVAANYLSRNTDNREAKKYLVHDYATQMERGEWSLNGQAIVFDEDGRLVDGQHRLQAIVETGSSVDIVVVRGVSREAFATIDTGKNRNAADALFISGYKKYHTEVAAAAKVVMSYRKTRTLSKSRWENTTVIDFVRDNEDLFESAEYCIEAAVSKVITPGIAIGFHYLFSKLDEYEADKYISEVASGLGLFDKDPAYIIREKLLLAKHSNHKMKRNAKATYFVLGWNYLRRNIKPKRIQLTKNGKIPFII